MEDLQARFQRAAPQVVRQLLDAGEAAVPLFQRIHILHFIYPELSIAEAFILRGKKNM